MNRWTVLVAAVVIALCVGVLMAPAPPPPTIYETSVVAFGNGLMEYSYQIGRDKTTMVLRAEDLTAYRAYLSRYGNLVRGKNGL